MPKIDEARREEVRTKLIDAAVDVLCAEGPGGVTSRRILKEAGLSAGALYHYFSSLDELYGAVAQRFVALDAALLGEVPGDGSDPASAGSSQQLADTHVAVLRELFGRSDQVLAGQLRIAAHTNARVRTAMQAYDRAIVERSGRLNRASQEAGLFRSDADPYVLVEVVSVFVEGFNTRGRATGFATSRERVLQLFLEMLSERVVLPDNPDSVALSQRIEEINPP